MNSIIALFVGAGIFANPSPLPLCSAAIEDQQAGCTSFCSRNPYNSRGVLGCDVIMKPCQDESGSSSSYQYHPACGCYPPEPTPPVQPLLTSEPTPSFGRTLPLCSAAIEDRQAECTSFCSRNTNDKRVVLDVIMQPCQDESGTESSYPYRLSCGCYPTESTSSFQELLESISK